MNTEKEVCYAETNNHLMRNRPRRRLRRRTVASAAVITDAVTSLMIDTTFDKMQKLWNSPENTYHLNRYNYYFTQNSV